MNTIFTGFLNPSLPPQAIELLKKKKRLSYFEPLNEKKEFFFLMIDKKED